MLKKKNIAMMMAATTVATSVAPVFAAVNVENVNEANLIAEVEKLLATKYTDSKECVYTITANGDEITTISELKKEIEKVKTEEYPSLEVRVIDKGHKTIDGKIVNTEKTTKRLYNAEEATHESIPMTTESLITAFEEVDEISAELDETGEVVVITFANGTTLEIERGDEVLDLTKPVDAKGNALSLNADAKLIAGFKTYEGTELQQTIPAKLVSVFTYDEKVIEKITKEVSELRTSEGYTIEGAEFVRTMIKARRDAGYNVVENGSKYNVKLTNVADLEIEVSKDGGYKLDLEVEVSKVSRTVTPDKVIVTLTSEVQKDLATILNDITTTQCDDPDATIDAAIKVGDTRYARLIGDSRFETAVEVSKAQYADAGEADSANAVILVGEEAIVDGLAAAPLAAKKDAPILLTKKDTVPAETMAEIKRLVEKNATIYLVGGEHNISKDVEAQLIKEMNANIVRLAGEDRFETSLEIAKELETETSEAFVVGGDGLADAMSIAAIAANETDDVTPIIVTPEAGLSRDAKDFLKDSAITNVKVVGGEARVSTQVLKDIKNIAIGAERIAGETRNETNAEVIKEFAGEGFDSVYVAKDGDKALVDALAAAPLAGANNGVIVLATDDLTKSQVEAVTNGTDEDSLTQVGGGVGATVIQKLLKALGL